MKINEAYDLYKVHMLDEGCSHKTYQNYQAAISSITRAIGDIPIELVGTHQIVIWKEDMRHNGNKPASINSKLSILRKVLAYLREHGVGVMDYEKIRFEKRIPTERTWLNPEEMQKLIDFAKNDRDKAIVALLAETGCRVSEILNLDRIDIEEAEFFPDQGVYEIMVCGKGDRTHQEKNRPAWFSSSVMAYVRSYLDSRQDRFKPIFISGQNSRITVSRVEQIIHEITVRAGLEKVVTPHTLRHSRISDILLNGAPMQDAKDFAGHSNITTTINIYRHVTNEHKRQTASKFATRVV